MHRTFLPLHFKMLSALISRAYCIPSLEASQLIKPTNSEHSYYANPTGSGTKQRQCVCIWEMYHWLMWKLCHQRIFPHDEDVDKSRPYFAVVECLQFRDRSAHCVWRQELGWTACLDPSVRKSTPACGNGCIHKSITFAVLRKYVYIDVHTGY